MRPRGGIGCLRRWRIGLEGSRWSYLCMAMALGGDRGLGLGLEGGGGTLCDGILWELIVMQGDD